MKRIILFLVLYLLLAACGSRSAPPSGSGEPEPKGEEPTAESPGEAVITYEVSGGIAGVMDNWTIYSDGRVESSDGQEKQVSPEDVQALVDLAEGLGFYEMDSDYSTFSTCRDCFNFKVTVSTSEKIKSVSAVEDGSGVPEEFWILVQHISSLVR